MFRAVRCRCSLPEWLSGSISSLLARLGVEEVVDEKAAEHRSERRCTIRVSYRPARAGHDGTPHGLVMSIGSASDADGENSCSRWLPPPFLESTLAPVLMELVLEHRAQMHGEGRISRSFRGTPG
jgi:hypothetical protein